MKSRWQIHEAKCFCASEHWTLFIQFGNDSSKRIVIWPQGSVIDTRLVQRYKDLANDICREQNENIMKNRTIGHYWVMKTRANVSGPDFEDWDIAWWNGSRWFKVGWDEGVLDDHWDGINENEITR